MAEILITLILLGALAAFTVPSLLTPPISSGSMNYTAKAKQVAFMLFSAYQTYLIQNGPSKFATVSSLTPYMSYISLVSSTTETISNPPKGAWTNGGSATCGWVVFSTNRCYNLSNGGVLWYNDAEANFGGTNSTNALWFNFDPDGSGPASALQIWLTFNGNIYTAATLPTTMTYGYALITSTVSPTTEDASWFTGF